LVLRTAERPAASLTNAATGRVFLRKQPTRPSPDHERLRGRGVAAMLRPATKHSAGATR